MKQNIETLRKQSNKKYLGFDCLYLNAILDDEFLKLDGQNIKYILQNLIKYIGSYQLKSSIVLSNDKRSTQYEKEFITKDKKKKVIFDIYIHGFGDIRVTCKKIENISIEDVRNMRFNTELGCIEEDKI